MLKAATSSIYVARLGESAMSRIQLALNVDNLETAIAFYSRLFRHGAGEAQTRLRQLRHRRSPLKLVLLENPGQGAR